METVYGENIYSIRLSFMIFDIVQEGENPVTAQKIITAQFI